MGDVRHELVFHAIERFELFDLLRERPAALGQLLARLGQLEQQQHRHDVLSEELGAARVGQRERRPAGRSVQRDRRTNALVDQHGHRQHVLVIHVRPGDVNGDRAVGLAGIGDDAAPLQHGNAGRSDAEWDLEPQHGVRDRAGLGVVDRSNGLPGVVHA